jgi:diguanylate cyclase (GGDEF)-like protein/PAS domain S-box-containing protein
MSRWPEGWSEILEGAPEGIVVCDATAAEHPVLYANRAFAEMSGHPIEKLLGTNLRMLQGTDRDQDVRQRLRESLERGEPCRALVRNYRPDGTLFWNEMLIQPVRDAKGKIVQWVSYHRDVSERLPAAPSARADADATADTGAHTDAAARIVANGSAAVYTAPAARGAPPASVIVAGLASATASLANGSLPGGLSSVAGLPAWMREDRLTGLHSRSYFEELLRRDWQLAQRDTHEIGLTLFDIDDLSAYNDTFDKSAGDACIRRVARAISNSYRRGSDLVGRWEGGTFAVLTQGEAAANAGEYAKVVVQRVRDLLIHNPRAGNGSRYVTLSAGFAGLVPTRELPLDALVNACLTALKRAKTVGKNNICAAEARDFKSADVRG